MKRNCFSSGWVESFGLSCSGLPSARGRRPGSLWVRRDSMFGEQKSDAAAKNKLDSLSFKNIFKSFLHLWLTVTFPLQSHRPSFLSVRVLCCISVHPRVCGLLPVCPHGGQCLLFVCIQTVKLLYPC